MLYITKQNLVVVLFSVFLLGLSAASAVARDGVQDRKDPAEAGKKNQKDGKAEHLLFDFSDRKAKEAWYTVNDNVMGGISQGTVRIAKKKLFFTGSLSLKNRGGFASARTKKIQPNLHIDDHLKVRFKGDGRPYYLSLYVPVKMIAFSYRAEIKTTKDRWQEVTVPLKQFKATWFGRQLPDTPPVNAETVNAIGFLIADKKEGPFKLEVAWIKVIPGNDQE